MPEQPQANYITHVNNFLDTCFADNRLKPAHISLYMALFNIWNRNFFVNPFDVFRSDVMRSSHIGSKDTYASTLKDLHDFGYICYYPSESIGRPSQASIKPMKKKPDAGLKTGSQTPETGPLPVPITGHLIKHIKKPNKENGALPTKRQKKSGQLKPDKPDNPEEVSNFFRQMRFDPREASRFFNHYEANGWHQSNGLPIRNWKAAAKKWVSNTSNFKTSNNDASSNRLSSGPSNYADPL